MSGTRPRADERRGERRRLVGDDQVAGQSHAEAGTGRVPAHDSDDRLGHVGQAGHDLLCQRELGGVVGRAVAHLLDVAARAERVLVAADHHDSHLRVDGRLLQHVAERAAHHPVDRVAGCRPVEADRQHAVPGLQHQRLLVAHCSISLTRFLETFRLEVVGSASTKLTRVGFL